MEGAREAEAIDESIMENLTEQVLKQSPSESFYTVHGSCKCTLPTFYLLIHLCYSSNYLFVIQ